MKKVFQRMDKEAIYTRFWMDNSHNPCKRIIETAEGFIEEMVDEFGNQELQFHKAMTRNEQIKLYKTQLKMKKDDIVEELEAERARRYESEKTNLVSEYEEKLTQSLEADEFDIFEQPKMKRDILEDKATRQAKREIAISKGICNNQFHGDLITARAEEIKADLNDMLDNGMRIEKKKETKTKKQLKKEIDAVTSKYFG